MYTPHKVLPLTSLRFFAAFYVVLYHTVDSAFPHVRNSTTTYGRLLDLGYIAVSFFFTLSGYILAVSYLPRRVSKMQFWQARVARVYPLFILTLLLDTPQYLAGLTKQMGLPLALRVTFERILENALLLQAWVPSFRGLDFPNWSLSAEGFFYLLCPFLLPVIARFRVTALALSAIAIYAVGMLGIAATMQMHASVDVLKFNPLLHLSAFVCGTLLGASRFKLQLHSTFAPALLMLALLCFVVVVAFYPYISVPFIHDGLLVPAFGCVILAFDCGNRKLNGLLSSGILVLLGEASYALYLLHIPLWHFVYHLRLEHSPIAYICYLTNAVALSVMCFLFVETPLRRSVTSRRSLLSEDLQQRVVTLLASVQTRRKARAGVQPGITVATDNVQLVASNIQEG